VRVSEVPPEVYNPGLHVLQLSARATLYAESEPQSLQDALEAAAKRPGVHSVQLSLPPAAAVPAGQDATTDVPSHLLPAGQEVQVVRVLALLPEVKLPAAHVVQVLAPIALKRESSLQAEHVAMPDCDAKAPAAHCVHVLDPAAATDPALHLVIVENPSAVCPGGLLVHALRVPLSPPEVYDPAAHVSHLAAPADDHLLSLPHALHCALPVGANAPGGHSPQADAPAAANEPALHTKTWLVPSQRWPSWHSEHVLRVLELPPEVNEPELHVWHSSEPALLYCASLPQLKQDPDCSGA
jgi:hypothetical protein